MMKVTYIGHSGVMVELEDKALLFDYYKGELPDIDEEKKLYVFVSHKHGDHYNRDVLALREKRDRVTYVFSGDIMTGRKAQQQGILRMTAHQELQVDDMLIQTLKSNDEGVAFLVKTNGKNIYHAGDLNWWHWEGEPEADNLFMERTYKAELEILKEEMLKGEMLDAAFVVLDPRQEEQFFLGFDWFMRHINPRYAVPIHMWDDYTLAEKLKEMELSKPYRASICSYEKSGEVLELL